MKLFLTVLALVPGLAAAGPDAAEFKPGHAADQSRVTSLSLDKGFQQFLALSMWQKTQTKLKMTELRFEQAKRDLTRAKELHKSGTITESKYSAIYFDYRVLEVERINLPVDITKHHLTAQYHLLRMIEDGNPGTDQRMKQAQLMLEGAELEIQTLTSSLKLAEAAKVMAEGFMSNGRELKSKAALTQAELEKRELIHQSAIIHIQEIQSQIQLAQEAREGFARVAKRLGTGQP